MFIPLLTAGNAAGQVLWNAIIMLLLASWQSANCGLEMAMGAIGLSLKKAFFFIKLDRSINYIIIIIILLL